MTAKYPNRPPFFANRFCRLLTKSAAAMEIGPEACWLLSVIAHQEDVCRYSKPVAFWNEQLKSVCGLKGSSRLSRVRRSAIDNGWLHYDPGSKSKPGKYWVLVPNGVSLDDDSPTCESGLPSQNGMANHVEARLPSQNGKATQTKPDGKPSPFIPTPSPIPKGPRFCYPDDFQEFWKVFPSGRKSGKKEALKAWKKAIADVAPTDIIESAKEYASSDVGRGEFVKSPAAWLNQGCWDDDREAWKDKRKQESATPDYPNLATRQGGVA